MRSLALEGKQIYNDGKDRIPSRSHTHSLYIYINSFIERRSKYSVFGNFCPYPGSNATAKVLHLPAGGVMSRLVGQLSTAVK